MGQYAGHRPQVGSEGLPSLPIESVNAALTFADGQTVLGTESLGVLVAPPVGRPAQQPPPGIATPAKSSKKEKEKKEKRSEDKRDKKDKKEKKSKEKSKEKTSGKRKRSEEVD